MSSAIEKTNGTTAIQRAPFEFTPEQMKMIRDSFLNGASEQEATVLMELARLRRLNPITRQIHFVKRWDAQRQREVWAAQVGIDGFRAIAERTGLYDGQDEPEFEYDSKGALRLCRVRIYRKDWSRPAVGVAHFAEYVQKKKDGHPTHMWAEKPHVMLSKCAEALAHRKAFPEDTSGLYAPEEMPDERELNPPPPKSPSTVTPPKTTAEAKAQLTAKLAEQPKTVEGQVVATKPAPKMTIIADDEPKPPPVDWWKRIVAVGDMKGLSVQACGRAIRDLTKKSSSTTLTEDDFKAFVRWMEDELPKEPPPPTEPPPELEPAPF
jgi:phage recombination protein Bet